MQPTPRLLLKTRSLVDITHPSSPTHVAGLPYPSWQPHIAHVVHSIAVFLYVYTRNLYIDTTRMNKSQLCFHHRARCERARQ